MPYDPTIYLGAAAHYRQALEIVSNERNVHDVAWAKAHNGLGNIASRRGRHAEARAEYDLEVNVKAEQEIEVILQHLEYQNAILIAMVEKLGVSFEKPVRSTHP